MLDIDMLTMCRESMDAFGFEYDSPAMAEATQAELYDPSKPEFITPATLEEVEALDADLLAKQIARLERHASRRKSNPECRVASHYEHVASSLRGMEARLGCNRGKTKRTHRRVVSAPDWPRPDEAVDRPRCRSHSQALVSVSELPSEEEENEEGVLPPTAEEPEGGINDVRDGSTFLISSVTQLNKDSLSLLQRSVPQRMPALSGI